MLNELLKNKKFIEISEKFLRFEEILDIIVFGSTIRGKDYPNDLDILIIFPKKINHEIEYQLRKDYEKLNLKIDLIAKTYNELFSAHFLAKESIVHEGYSIKHKKMINSLLGYKGFVLFRYYLEKMNNSDRMRFYYSLYGRGKEKGVLDTYYSIKFSDSIILVPVEYCDQIKDFFYKKEIKFDWFKVLFEGRKSDKKFLELK